MNKDFYVLAGALALGAGCMAQIASSQIGPSAKQAPKKAGTSTTLTRQHRSNPALSPAASTEELDQIKQTIADQRKEEQQRFDLLKQQNQQLSEQLKATQDNLTVAEQKIGRLATEEDPQITKLESAVAAIKSTQVATTGYIEHEKKLQPEREHPTALRYKGITITPGGFLAAEALYRTHAENADIGTSWNSIPYDTQTMAHLGEFRMTARQSRLTLRTDGAVGATKLTGYYELDFLGTGYGASETQTSGWSDRVRQLWGRAQLPSGWTFTGGQMWSLMTTNRIGAENLAEFLVPMVDGTQLLGNDYARQNAIRLSKSFDNYKITAAFSAENSATVGVTPSNVPSSVSSIISGLSTTGTSALSNTTYSTNVAPDLIAKVAFDPTFGHFEIRAIGRTFRDRLNSTAAVAATPTTPAIPATPGQNDTVLDGGLGGAAIVPVFTKKVSYVVEGNWGAIGRYGATSTDVVVKPNGQLSPEKSIHGLTGFETHPTSRLDSYVFASDEYLPRNHGYGLRTINTSACNVEATVATYSCAANVRNLAAATVGFWYRIYKGNAGMVQYGGDWAYMTKNTWSGVGRAPKGVENVFETSLRYYLP
jgi:hypothetical protein